MAGAGSDTRASLSAIVLPEALGRRDYVVPESWRAENFDARYDFHTLIYDAVYLPARGIVALFCPKLLNFAKLLARAEIRLDGARVRPGWIRRHRRYDVVPLPAKCQPAELSIDLGDWRAAVPVNPAEPEAFAGMNCLMTLSRNNALEWIHDWALFHARAHGARGIVFIDNGSDAYDLGAIEETLARVPGIERIRVLAANHPYGPVGGRRKPTKGKFLQAGVTNIARWRYFRAARAVLVNDIDELVVSPAGQSLFDATVAAPGGYLKVRGVWRLADLVPGVMPRHRDHIYPPAADEICPAKYCIVPNGPLRRYSWGTHALDRHWLSSRYETTDFRYFHCRSISDLWKRDRAERSNAHLDADPEAVALYARYLA